MAQKDRLRAGVVTYFNTKPLINPLSNSCLIQTGGEIDLFHDNKRSGVASLDMDLSVCYNWHSYLSEPGTPILLQLKPL